MKIVCVGGGPAGLYFALLAKRRHPGHEVTVLERNRSGATYGWGVVFWDDFLETLYGNDPESAREVHETAVLWEGQQVRVGGAPTAHVGGYGYSISRGMFLDVLARRAAALGVDVQYESEFANPNELADADLVVACDGAGSIVRARYAEQFGTTIATGRNRYIWLGTTKVFDAFVFAFERTAAGWIWFHAYPSAAGTSTCIIECSPETWHGLGLADLEPADGIALLERVFADALEGHPLLSASSGSTAGWLAFRQVANHTWYHGNVVLLGDAAHTTHFTIGSGTKLAVGDAVALAEVLPVDASNLSSALQAYDERRNAVLRPLQEAAGRSMTWFEDVDMHLGGVPDPVKFAYALSKRRGGYASWRYQLHLATQISGLRRIRRELSSARRTMRARRQGRLQDNAVG